MGTKPFFLSLSLSLALQASGPRDAVLHYLFRVLLHGCTQGWYRPHPCTLAGRAVLPGSELGVSSKHQLRTLACVVQAEQRTAFHISGDSPGPTCQRVQLQDAASHHAVQDGSDGQTGLVTWLPTFCMFLKLRPRMQRTQQVGRHGWAGPVG